MGSSSGVETFHIEGQEQGLEDEQQQADTKCWQIILLLWTQWLAATWEHVFFVISSHLVLLTPDPSIIYSASFILFSSLMDSLSQLADLTSISTN